MSLAGLISRLVSLLPRSQTVSEYPRATRTRRSAAAPCPGRGSPFAQKAEKPQNPKNLGFALTLTMSYVLNVASIKPLSESKNDTPCGSTVPFKEATVWLVSVESHKRTLSPSLHRNPARPSINNYFLPPLDRQTTTTINALVRKAGYYYRLLLTQLAIQTAKNSSLVAFQSRQCHMKWRL